MKVLKLFFKQFDVIVSHHLELLAEVGASMEITPSELGVTALQLKLLSKAESLSELKKATPFLDESASPVVAVLKIETLENSNLLITVEELREYVADSGPLTNETESFKNLGEITSHLLETYQALEVHFTSNPTSPAYQEYVVNKTKAQVIYELLIKLNPKTELHSPPVENDERAWTGLTGYTTLLED